MTDCSQLQALLDGAKQERQALDDPETYCQDQCDPGDVECIKQCFRTIPERRQAADQEIANAKYGILVCSTLGGTWAITAFSSTGQFTITSWNNENARWLGTIDMPDFPQAPAIDGSWDNVSQAIEFVRPLADGSVEGFRGSVDLSTQPPTMKGFATISPPPGEVNDLPLSDWTAQKQL